MMQILYKPLSILILLNFFCLPLIFGRDNDNLKLFNKSISKENLNLSYFKTVFPELHLSYGSSDSINEVYWTMIDLETKQNSFLNKYIEYIPTIYITIDKITKQFKEIEINLYKKSDKFMHFFSITNNMSIIFSESLIVDNTQVKIIYFLNISKS